MSGENKHLWVVMGPAACGKTTVGRYLASQVESSLYVEGDWSHPPANVHKLEFNEPLTDEDRADWLQELTKDVINELERFPIIFVSCSALRRSDRGFFHDAVKSENDDPSSAEDESEPEAHAGLVPKIRLHFLYLDMEVSMAAGLAEERQILERHYVSASTVRQEYKILELPDEEEGGTFTVVKNNGTVGEVQAKALREVKMVMGIDY